MNNGDINQILVNGTFDKPISNANVVSRVRPLHKISDKHLNKSAESAVLTSMALVKQPKSFMKSLMQRSMADELTAVTGELAFRS